MMAVRESRPKNLALRKHADRRAQSGQNRIADAITGFAGSMSFVYVHIVLFAVWMLLLERKPWPTLTLAVSLEAIFLSTFVMISQNRSDERRQVLADQQWQFVQAEERQNEELLRLSRQILELTETTHELAVGLREERTARATCRRAPEAGSRSPERSSAFYGSPQGDSYDVKDARSSSPRRPLGQG